jgi:hypothetical protein
MQTLRENFAANSPVLSPERMVVHRRSTFLNSPSARPVDVRIGQASIARVVRSPARLWSARGGRARATQTQPLGWRGKEGAGDFRRPAPVRRLAVGKSPAGPSCRIADDRAPPTAFELDDVRGTDGCTLRSSQHVPAAVRSRAAQLSGSRLLLAGGLGRQTSVRVGQFRFE